MVNLWEERYRELERTLEHIFMSLARGEMSSRVDSINALETESANLQLFEHGDQRYVVCKAETGVKNYYFAALQNDRIVRENMSPINAFLITGDDQRIICKIFFDVAEEGVPLTLEWGHGAL